MTTHASNPTLVLGGTGKTGRRVAERLRTRGLPVRVGSRSAAPPFDWGGHVDLGAGAARSQVRIRFLLP